MSGFSNIVKNGWHPDKKQDFKKQVTSIWKKEDSDYEARASRASRPLSSLRDPASFGPPPRHVALGGGASPGGPAASASRASSSGSHASPSRQHAPATPARPSLPARPGAASAAAGEDEERPPSPRPYRMDTTGLATSHLPPPPTRRDGSGISRSPPPPAAPKPAIKAAPPGLPPRLPPRTTPSPHAPSRHAGSAHPPPPPPPPPPANDIHMNQDAIDRLGRAGISVPGLGIGAPSGGAHGGQAQQQSASNGLSAIKTLAGSASASPHPTPPPAPQLGELQARLAKVNAGGGVGGAGSLAAGKKKPPPPPAKKPGLATNRPAHKNDDDDDVPPPIPMATRPQGW